MTDAAGISTTKLALLAVLGFCAVLLGGAVLLLQLKVTEKSLQLGLRYSVSQGKLVPVSSSSASQDINGVAYDSNGQHLYDGSIGSYYSLYDDDGTGLFLDNKDEMHVTFRSTTTKSAVPTGSWDINLWNTFPAPEGSAWKTSGEAYWRQVLAYLKDWDVAVWPADPTDYRASLTAWQVRNPSAYHTKSNNWTMYPYPRLALERAAYAGHPMAQHYLANAHASGVWPVPAGPYEQQSASSSDRSPLVEDLHVFEEWIPSAHGDHPQVTKSFLLWHMAAMAGNIESAMALAYRFDHSMDNDQRDTSATCQDALPYYQAAADGIIDQLETSLHSRAKVTPPMDKHILAQVHMHGGTSSQLDRNNKPDESKEAIQFYHLKATTVPWSMRKSAGADDNDEETKKKKITKKGKRLAETEGIDVSAAYTLGQLYHYGARGVEQNLTKSLEYYEIAGLNGHWESSGHACTFHLWGMGVEQDVYEALTYCRLGAPMTLEDCRNRHQWILARTHKKDDEDYRAECDSEALNGLGLLHLLGVPGVIKVDMVEAEKYFTLAKETGSTDAHYNLAMMWLGWKTHFKTINDLEEGGVSSADESAQIVLPLMNIEKKTTTSERFALHLSKVGNDQVFKGPTQEDVNNAMKLLVVAANKGHVQAKHRLAMIYSEGIRLQTSVLKYESVKKDCTKAKGLFQWIVENASPTRSKRLKSAYKEYIAGNLDVSLRNYIAAAETGSSIGQVNAAFLMERGVCLGLDAGDCAKASVRLWKAAAARGNPEACLRVGDFYYYGRLRGKKLPVGPFGWIQYFLYPEKYIPVLLDDWSKKLMQLFNEYTKDDKENDEPVETPSSMTCEAENGVCLNEESSEDEDSDDFTESDLQMASYYYQVAAEKHQSARANFNLGFMHQWGLGLKQDFPLAKRHYDLAVSGNAREAELAVQIAFMAMNAHEAVIRWKVLLEDWWFEREHIAEREDHIESPKAIDQAQVGQPVHAQDTARRKTREEIIMSHLFNWSSAAILVLVMIAVQVMVMMKGRQRQR
jgi:TPR repeat protein